MTNNQTIDAIRKEWEAEKGFLLIDDVAGTINGSFRGAFVSFLIKKPLETITAAELKTLRSLLMSGGSSYIVFDSNSWTTIKRELDGFSRVDFSVSIPNERYINESYADRFNEVIELGAGYIKLIPMCVEEEEAMFKKAEVLPEGFIPM